MAHWTSHGRQARITRSGGLLNSVMIYMAAAGAAVRTTTAVSGHLQPSEQDLQILGIEHTAAYAAVARD